ncbi:molybdenum cofactor biosynthesis protein MoaE [Tsuneonella sp. CC-YZS046]|uniref:molybdenum cofactor biosynthesis protein MoaE n=1 Tax=Tsuneonella sp. CC-YZS046 TaxID=3042152 RepID=UPI002D7A0A5C|nr:molybdenum cofactor biosynthesis protein MoaE [Tsuneonella sp. CC-YZS046]WRO67357.1 molybdenum cofactor biosynthesis protein MoaE [Tsuneonella sp. CC-YZS046]
MREVHLLDRAFSPGTELERFMAAHPASGGIVSFAGQVRSGDGVEALELSHYGPLTLPGMERLVDDAQGRWLLDGVLAIHRVGLMRPGEAIVMVATAARHRRDAFESADFIMDHLKSDAWFWKREKRADGWHWIEPRPADREDIGRWH